MGFQILNSISSIVVRKKSLNIGLISFDEHGGLTQLYDIAMSPYSVTELELVFVFLVNEMIYRFFKHCD